MALERSLDCFVSLHEGIDQQLAVRLDEELPLPSDRALDDSHGLVDGAGVLLGVLQQSHGRLSDGLDLLVRAPRSFEVHRGSRTAGRMRNGFGHDGAEGAGCSDGEQMRGDSGGLTTRAGLARGVWGLPNRWATAPSQLHRGSLKARLQESRSCRFGPRRPRKAVGILPLAGHLVAQGELAFEGKQMGALRHRSRPSKSKSNALHEPCWGTRLGRNSCPRCASGSRRTRRLAEASRFVHRWSGPEPTVPLRKRFTGGDSRVGVVGIEAGDLPASPTTLVVTDQSPSSRVASSQSDPQPARTAETLLTNQMRQVQWYMELRAAAKR